MEITQICRKKTPKKSNVPGVHLQPDRGDWRPDPPRGLPRRRLGPGGGRHAHAGLHVLPHGNLRRGGHGRRKRNGALEEVRVWLLSTNGFVVAAVIVAIAVASSVIASAIVAVAAPAVVFAVVVVGSGGVFLLVKFQYLLS